jgi:uncharacterized protein YfbU (UPF0304 family)
MAPKDERFEMRVDEDLLSRVDEWRARQDKILSRAEAMRRLAEMGLAHSTNKPPTLSDGDKLMLLAMKDLAEHLKLKNSALDFAAEVIYGGHDWALGWQLPGVFHGHQDNPKNVRFVVDVLTMWDHMERGYEALSEKDKAFIAKKAAPLGESVCFRGFDGNGESEHRGIALFLVEKMERFARFKGRKLNAHIATLDAHERMLSLFENMQQSLIGGELSADQIADLLRAQFPPERRRG